MKFMVISVKGQLIKKFRWIIIPMIHNSGIQPNPGRFSWLPIASYQWGVLMRVHVGVPCGSYPFCCELLYGSYDMVRLIFKNVHPVVSSFTLVYLRSTFGINLWTQYLNFKIGVILGHLTHPTMQRKVQSNIQSNISGNIQLTKTVCYQYLHWNLKGMVVYQRPNRCRKNQSF